MFDSIFSTQVSSTGFFLMALTALVSGLGFAWIMSLRVHSTRRFFVVSALIPFVVGVVVTFVNGNIGAGVAVGGAFSLVRFRSAQGSADEIASILIAMTSGIAFGMGYLAYGVLILVILSLVFFLLSRAPFFARSSLCADRLLRVTIPESLEYGGVFDEVFARYLAEHESVGVKTTGMGSMFRLSFRVRMKDPAGEKAFIDELRILNGNLEISLVPYAEPANQL